MKKESINTFINYLKKNSAEDCLLPSGYRLKWSFIKKLYSLYIETGIDQLEAYNIFLWISGNDGGHGKQMSHVFKMENRKYVPYIESLLHNEYVFKAKDVFSTEQIFEAARLLEKEGIKFTEDIKRKWLI